MRALVTRAVRAAGHDVVAEAADYDATLALVERALPDALFLDSRLPPHGIAALVPQIVAVAPSVRIYIVASLAERSLIRAAVAAGAHGACLRPIRQSAVAELLNRTVLQG